MNTARQIPNVRWRIAALLFFASVINYIDRQTLSVLASEITAELGISDIEYSYILSAFTFCYMRMYIVSGLLIDRWGTRIALSLSMVWWSIANALHAFSTGVFSLGAFRALLGIGESGNFLAAEKAISEWFPPRTPSLKLTLTLKGEKSVHYRPGRTYVLPRCPGLGAEMTNVDGFCDTRERKPILDN